MSHYMSLSFPLSAGLFMYRSSDDDSTGTLILGWFKSGTASCTGSNRLLHGIVVVQCIESFVRLEKSFWLFWCTASKAEFTSWHLLNRIWKDISSNCFSYLSRLVFCISEMFWNILILSYSACRCPSSWPDAVFWIEEAKRQPLQRLLWRRRCVQKDGEWVAEREEWW